MSGGAFFFNGFLLGGYAMTRVLRIFVLAAFVCVVSVAMADGMIVPVQPDTMIRGSWAVKYHHVNMIVRDQVAAVTIDQEFLNTGGGMLEVEYLFPVPPGAAIDAMTLVVNGEEFKAKLLPAEEARRIYEGIVRSKKDPALLEYVGFGLYRTKAFPLEPGKPAKVLIHYNHVCPRNVDLVEVMYPLNTEKFSAKPIEDVSVTIDIKAERDITTIYSPSHEVKIYQKDPRQAIVTYAVKNAIPSTDLLVFYKAKDEDVGASLISYQPDEGKDGYFMLLASPNPRTAATSIVPKDIVVVIDRSGSMSSDNKLSQAKEALRFVLANLNTEDRFNIIAYSDYVESFFKQLTPAGKAYIDQARDKVDRLEPMGGTNIHEALKQAMAMVANPEPASGRPVYVIFLTDGQPTIGSRNIGEILADTKKANTANARIFALGVGYDVNVQLLDKLVEDNRGASDYVKPAEPLETKVSAMYNKVKNPVLTDVQVSIPGVELTNCYPNPVGDLFHGSQLVLVGRYNADGARGLSGRRGTLLITGRYEGKERTFEYPFIFREPGRSSADSHIERLWATRRVGFLLDQIQLHGQSTEVVDEIVRLSRDYGIITPYTSFLADETTRLDNVPELAMKMAEAADALAPKGAAMGGAKAQMDAKNRLEYKEAERAAAAEVRQVEKKDGGFEVGQALQSLGYADKDDYEGGRRRYVTTVRQIGSVALYQRGTVWVTPETESLDLVKDAKKIKKIARYSDEYFALVGRNSIDENKLLASQGRDEQLLVKLHDQVYLIE